MNDWEKNKSDGFFSKNNNTFNFAILKNAERTWAPAVKTSTLALSDVLIQRKKTHIMNWYYTMPNVVTLCRMRSYTPDVHGIITPLLVTIRIHLSVKFTWPGQYHCSPYTSLSLLLLLLSLFVFNSIYCLFINKWCIWCSQWIGPLGKASCPILFCFIKSDEKS